MKIYPFGKFQSAHWPKYGTAHIMKEANFVHCIENCAGDTHDTPNRREFCVESYSFTENFV